MKNLYLKIKPPNQNTWEFFKEFLRVYAPQVKILQVEDTYHILVRNPTSTFVERFKEIAKDLNIAILSEDWQVVEQKHTPITKWLKNEENLVFITETLALDANTCDLFRVYRKEGKLYKRWIIKLDEIKILYKYLIKEGHLYDLKKLAEIIYRKEKLLAARHSKKTIADMLGRVRALIRAYKEGRLSGVKCVEKIFKKK